MRKKIFKNIIVVALFIIAVACSSSKVVNTIDYKQYEDKKPNSIQVVTEEGQEYQFSYSDYSIKDDTLYGGKKSGYLKNLKPF